MTTVVQAAWAAAGSPVIQPDLTPLPTGTCARCAAGSVEITRVTGAISKLFTAFDGWHYPTLPGLCHACAWAYRTPCLRRSPHLVSAATGQLAEIAASKVTSVLAGGPLAHTTALVVPLRPGRKHLLPEARWGAITTDHATIPWSRADAGRMTALQRLRDHGFGTRMLTQPAPTWQVLRRQPLPQWAHIVDDWRRLDPWRQRRPWLALALHITTPTATRRAA